MARRVFVTGGSGFVGSALIDELRSRGHDIVALQGRRNVKESPGVKTVAGDLFDPVTQDQALTGCDAIIHLVGIIFEKPRRGITFERLHYEAAAAMIDAAKRNGIKRFILMSALGVRPAAISRYHQTKYKAEQYLRDSGLDWTIIRPSMIHGPRGQFMAMEAKWARGEGPPFFFMPYFGAGLLGRGGAGRLQPVDVKEVARAFADALEKPATIGEVYPMGGSEPLTWPELHRIAAQAIIGKRRPVVALPAWFAKLLTHAVPRFLLPFNRDQVVMSQEDNTCDLAKFERDFGWKPQSYSAGLASYVKEL